LQVPITCRIADSAGPRAAPVADLDFLVPNP
jgi:hypothetical protein